MFALSRFGLTSCRLDQAEQTLRCYRKLVDPDAERGERVGKRVGHRRRRADVPPSPMPRKPPSVVGEALSRCTTCIGGISQADGTR